MRPHGRATVDPSNPRAWAICPRCRFQVNHSDLSWQMRWAGSRLINTGMLVCSRCLDEPNEQERVQIIPPDPVPIQNPRTEVYDFSQRITGAGQASGLGDAAGVPGDMPVEMNGTAAGTGTAAATGLIVAVGAGSATGAGAAAAVREVLAAAAGTAAGTSTATALQADPYFGNVVLLIGPTGADAAAATTDESPAPHTLTFSGNAQVDTGQSVFGSSLQFDGTGDYLSSVDSADWDFGANPFTIEFIVRFSSGIASDEALIGQWSGNAGTSSWFFYLTGNVLTFRFIATGGAVKDTTVSWTPTINTDYVLCAERGSSDKIRIYRDGVMVASATHAFTVNSTGVVVDLTIGRLTGFSSYDLTGRMEEIRITKGVPRYDSDSGYTPSTAKFPRTGTSSSVGTAAGTSTASGYGVGGPILDGLSATGAWSMGRQLLSAYGGSFYTDAGGGAISSFLDQSGNSRNLTQATNRPTASTAGPNSRACADFDGTNDILNSAAALSTFISNSAGYCVVSFLADDTSSNAALIYQNDPVWCDDGGFVGTHIKNGNLQAYNWDGNADTPTAQAISTATAYVVEWRHEGGTVYQRINGGTEVSTASGNTSTMIGALRLGRTGGASTAFADIKIFEMAIFSTVPALATRDALVLDFKNWIGA